MRAFRVKIRIPVLLVLFATGGVFWIGKRTSEWIDATTTNAASRVSVTLLPARAGVVITQPLQLTASVHDDPSNSGVIWSSTGGTLTNQTAKSATFTAKTAGVYTISARSRADASGSASASVGVTDLTGVATWRNDLMHSGVNPREYALTKTNVVSGKFGKLFSCPVDGWVFAQPLWIGNLLVGGKRHNVLFIATENDSLYAFDADDPGCKAVWSSQKVNLIPHDEKIAPLEDLQWDSISLGPVTGITGTPVIDPSSQTIYLVTVTESKITGTIIQRLHAINITSGREHPNSPVVIQASVKGRAYANSEGIVHFSAKMQKQRAALLLLNGVVYICWGSYFDKDPYHGWVIGYSASTLRQVSVFNDTVDGGRGGIWMSGASPAADSQGNIYLVSGNGDFNAVRAGGRNFGDTFLRLATTRGLSVADWFTPFNEKELADQDLDLGGGGAVLIPDGRGRFPHLVLGTAKSGMLYVLNPAKLGHYNSTGDSQIVQSFLIDKNGIYSTPLFWRGTLFVVANQGPVRAFRLDTDTNRFHTSPAAVSSQQYYYPGATPALSAAGTENGILWVIDPAKPGVLHAYDAGNVSAELWNSSQGANHRDQAGRGLKFTVPTIANGKVYVGTTAEVDVYGLLPD